MTLQQLIEMAILDAMGLLDEQERDQFESAFRSASPAVQAQVRREQTRLSRIESLLPDVQAPAGLRAAVLEAVRQQIDLGLAQGPADSQILPQFLHSRGVSRFWRAGALGLAAAATVLGVTTFYFIGQTVKLSQMVQGDAMVAAFTERFGASYVHRIIFDKDTRRVVFEPAVDGFKGEASLWVHPEFKLPKFFYQGPAVPDGRVYKLAIVDASDRVVETLSIFNPDGRVQTPVVAKLPRTGVRLAILASSEDGATPDSIVGRGELPGPSL